LDAVEYESKVERVIKNYVPQKIIKPGTGDYQFTREKFGTQAVTDGPRAYASQKDSRFMLSDLVREPLAIDAEERRAVEAQIRKEVDALAQETFESAKASGFEAGKKEGHEAGVSEVRERGAEMLESLNQLLESVEAHKVRLLQTQERFLMELVLKIARKVCLKEVGSDAQYIQRLIASMIEQTGTRDHLKIKISVQDYESLGELKASLVQRFGELKNLSIEASSALEQGRCEVESDLSTYSASLNAQLEIIEKAILGESA